MIEQFVITEETTREDLIDRVNNLEEEIQKLETKIKDKNQEIEDLALAPNQTERLADAADLMAHVGRIHNTPKAKDDWIAGK